MPAVVSHDWHPPTTTGTTTTGTAATYVNPSPTTHTRACARAASTFAHAGADGWGGGFLTQYWHQLLELVQADQLDPSAVVTYEMALEDAPRAYSSSSTPKRWGKGG